MFGVTDAERKVRAFVRERFADDSRAAYRHYAAGAPGLDFSAVLRFLEDAGVGGPVYRTILARLAFRFLDADENGTINYAEFEKGFGPQPEVNP